VKWPRHCRVAIPKQIREALGLEPDDMLSLSLTEGRLEIELVNVIPKTEGSPWARGLYQMFAAVPKACGAEPRRR
jgi:AbrB family looped-hinge helix DNA binding protein